jgi:type III pantothenate kinase
MLLAIDVGNTNIVIGVFDKNELFNWWRINTDRRKTVDEYALEIKGLLQMNSLKPPSIRGVGISNVVPALSPLMEELFIRHFGLKPSFITFDSRHVLPIKIDIPREVGADLIAAAAAALEKFGGPLIIVDFGTATTFSAISGDGEFLGGAIAAGLFSSIEGLYASAPHLPRISPEKPRGAIGKNTEDSLLSGIILGHSVMVEGMVGRFKSEMGENTKVIATGGLATLIAGMSHSIDRVEPFLVLEGIRIIYERAEQEGSL